MARTAAQIAGTMNVRLVGAEAGLVAYWRMDEGGGDTAFDVTEDGGHHLRLGDVAGTDTADPRWAPGKL